MAALRGSAVVTVGGRSAPHVERGCESLRGFDGRVVGWLATFGDVELRVSGYRGAGTYARAVLDTEGRTETGRLVLRPGGRNGSYVSGTTRVTFTCDARDDVSTAPGPRVLRDPKAGTAYVALPGGAVLTFVGLECGHERGGEAFVAGVPPRTVRIEIASSGAARVAWSVHGPEHELAATAEPALETGTFEAADGTRGAWTCDH